MNEVLDRVLAYGPDFLDRSLRLLTSPKTYLVEASVPSRKLLQQAIIFYSCCVVIAFLLQWPLSRSQNDITLAGVTSLLLRLCFATFMSGVLLLIFRILRGHANFASFFIVTLYIDGVQQIIWNLTAPVSKGIVISSDPDLYPRFKDLMDRVWSLDLLTVSPDHLALFEHGSIVAATLVSFVTVVAVGAWLFATWGAYRSICGLGRMRSFAAFILLQVVGGPLSFMFGMIQRALKVNLF